jgi:nitrate reductase gamma subunit
MELLYNLARGPLVWVAMALFVVGSLYKFSQMALLARQKDGLVYEYWSWKHALKSVFFWWIVPLGSFNARLNPVMAIVTWVFHVCLLLSPIFLLAHVAMFETSWNVGLWSTLPDNLADIMAIAVLVGCAFFLLRRLVLPQVKFVTSGSDFFILAVVCLPFLTGVLAYHQVADYRTLVTLHMLAGELMLALLPFTRLAHAIYALFVRGYTASEFGAVRQIKDW